MICCCSRRLPHMLLFAAAVTVACGVIIVFCIWTIVATVLFALLGGGIHRWFRSPGAKRRVKVASSCEEGAFVRNTLSK